MINKVGTARVLDRITRITTRRDHRRICSHGRARAHTAGSVRCFDP